MGRTRYHILDKTAPHFLTATTINWTPLFGKPWHAEVILNTFSFLIAQGRLTLFAYVIMENHLHWIASAHDLGRETRCFKSFTAQAIIAACKQRRAGWTLRQLRRHRAPYKTGQRYQVWQEGYHPKQILGPDMLRQKITYIHMNPVKRGYVDDPVHWRYSSARNYAGLPGLLPVTPAY